MLQGFCGWVWLIKIPYLEKLKMFYASFSWHFSAIENEDEHHFLFFFFPSKIQTSFNLSICFSNVWPAVQLKFYYFRTGVKCHYMSTKICHCTYLGFRDEIKKLFNYHLFSHHITLPKWVWHTEQESEIESSSLWHQVIILSLSGMNRNATQ